MCECPSLDRRASVTWFFLLIFFLMIRRPPRSTLDRSSAASDVYKRQGSGSGGDCAADRNCAARCLFASSGLAALPRSARDLSLIHISEPTRPY